MSKEITDWIKYELYPALYESIDTALPEHEFKRYSGGWRSKTYLDGSIHKDRADKTVISKKAPGWILENGGETLSLVDYVIRRDKTANTTYTVPVVSGDDLTCSYLITTPGVTVGIGTVVFSINGNTSYSATNGSGFNNLKVP